MESLLESPGAWSLVSSCLRRKQPSFSRAREATKVLKKLVGYKTRTLLRTNDTRRRGSHGVIHSSTPSPRRRNYKESQLYTWEENRTRPTSPF
jgi:hypothetical protein